MASLVWRWSRRPAGRWLPTLVLLCLLAPLVTLVWRQHQLQHLVTLPIAHRCAGRPFCRSDMAASELPPMAADDLTLTRELFTYLTSPHPATCVRLAKFGGTAKLRDDNIPVMEGQKSVCIDGEFASLLDRDCLVYTVHSKPDTALDRDVRDFDCQVAHAVVAAGGDTSGAPSPVGRLADLTSALHRRGHSDRTVQLLSVSAEGREFALLRGEVERGAQSVLHTRVQQLVVRLNFDSHLPVNKHIAFYRELYSTLLGLQSFGFYPFANEQNYMREANMAVPGLDERVYSSVDVAWLKTECFPPVPC